MIPYVLNTKNFTEQVTNDDKYLAIFLIITIIFIVFFSIIMFVAYIKDFILDKEYREFKKYTKIREKEK